ncbi:TetR/AcrR family transcriptional regulator [Patulibacter defluvii]|uniref:TetR/AcrR family transcriptional regulator n=1 Tax=Patulibacter defluvii TaxID=3095358 RepID=UPI002A757BD5|nr:TetR/AcrR family transcriptional regulator [Patulibacter sp. DM4]
MSTAPTPGRVATRRTRTRVALLEAAERAFVRHGFNGVTMERLAEEADVSVGSIYGHFSNKDGLYVAVAARAVDLFAEYLDRAYEASDSPLEQVMTAGDAYLRFHLEHPGLFRFIAFDGVESRPTIATEAEDHAFAERIAAVLRGFRDRIAAAVDCGEAGPHVDPELTARFLFAAWNGMVALTLRQDELGLDDDGITACTLQARRIVAEGLAAPGHRGPDGRAAVRLLDLPPRDAEA